VTADEIMSQMDHPLDNIRSAAFLQTLASVASCTYNSLFFRFIRHRYTIHYVQIHHTLCTDTPHIMYRYTTHYAQIHHTLCKNVTSCKATL